MGIDIEMTTGFGTLGRADLLGGVFVILMGALVVFLPIRALLWIDQRMGRFLLPMVGRRGVAVLCRLLGVALIALGLILLT